MSFDYYLTRKNERVEKVHAFNFSQTSAAGSGGAWTKSPFPLQNPVQPIRNCSTSFENVFVVIYEFHSIGQPVRKSVFSVLSASTKYHVWHLRAVSRNNWPIRNIIHHYSSVSSFIHPQASFYLYGYVKNKTPYGESDSVHFSTLSPLATHINVRKGIFWERYSDERVLICLRGICMKTMGSIRIIRYRRIYHCWRDRIKREIANSVGRAVSKAANEPSDSLMMRICIYTTPYCTGSVTLPFICSDFRVRLLNAI